MSDRVQEIEEHLAQINCDRWKDDTCTYIAVAHAPTDLAYLLTRLRAAEMVCRKARDAYEFGEAWAKDHQQDDYMVTLDHKDEIMLADLIADLCQILPTWEATR